MTKNELAEAIHVIIQTAVQESNGYWRRSYRREVEAILELVGKLTPEHDGNIKEHVPNYNKHLIKRVGRNKKTFTEEELADPNAILRMLGMIP